MDAMPRKPLLSPLLMPVQPRLDVMGRYHAACPQCGAPVSSFKIERDAGSLLFTVACDAGHRTAV